MDTSYIKVFSGTSILVKGLEVRLEEHKIKYLIKDKVESARLSGFGALRNAIEVFILNADLEKAQPIVDEYNNEISR